jgi:hypothetical protein
MEDRAKNLRLTIDGCRRLLKERSHSQDVEALRRLLDFAEAELVEIKLNERSNDR